MSDEINTFQQTGNYRLAGFDHGKNSSRRLGAYLQPGYPIFSPRLNSFKGCFGRRKYIEFRFLSCYKGFPACRHPLQCNRSVKFLRERNMLSCTAICATQVEQSQSTAQSIEHLVSLHGAPRKDALSDHPKPPRIELLQNHLY
jgi:hypothetical protein